MCLTNNAIAVDDGVFDNLSTGIKRETWGLKEQILSNPSYPSQEQNVVEANLLLARLKIDRSEAYHEEDNIYSMRSPAIAMFSITMLCLISPK